jgi:hypothetical protein
MALIESNPDGAWSTAQLCEQVYPGVRVEKKHRVALVHALLKIELPPMWCVKRINLPGSEFCLLNELSMESCLRWKFFGRTGQSDFEKWKASPFHIEKVRERVEWARRYHDAPPIEQLDMKIARKEQWLRDFGGWSGAAPVRRALAELRKEKRKLLAAPKA